MCLNKIQEAFYPARECQLTLAEVSSPHRVGFNSFALLSGSTSPTAITNCSIIKNKYIGSDLNSF